MQKAIPWVVGLTLFSALDRDGNLVSSGTLNGIQNAGWIWVPLLVICSIAAFFGMNNVITGTPRMPSTIQGISKTLYLVILGLAAAAIGAYLLVGLKINMWIVLPVVVVLPVGPARWRRVACHRLKEPRDVAQATGLFEVCWQHHEQSC